MILSEEQKILAEMARTFARSELRGKAAGMDQSGSYDAALLGQLGALGFLSVNIPVEYGGSGISDLLSRAVMIKELAAECASTAEIVAIHSMVNDILVRFGSDRQKEKYLTLAAKGALGAFAMTESAAGSDARAIATRAAAVDGGYEIQGEKCFISNIGADCGAYAIVFAAEEGEPKRISAFIVDRDTPGFLVGAPENKMGIRAAVVSSVTLDRCRVPAENRIGAAGEGFDIAMYALESGRIEMAAQAVGICQAALALSAAHIKSRRQFGRPLHHQQGLRWYIADMATRTEAAMSLIYDACQAYDNGCSSRKLSSMCKYFAAETAVYVTNKAVQLHGGCGYMKDYAVERLYRDARIIPIYEGTSEIQKNIIAKEILSELETGGVEL